MKNKKNQRKQQPERKKGEKSMPISPTNKKQMLAGGCCDEKIPVGKKDRAKRN
jgi:hypothetical protein